MSDLDPQTRELLLTGALGPLSSEQRGRIKEATLAKVALPATGNGANANDGGAAGAASSITPAVKWIAASIAIGALSIGSWQAKNATGYEAEPVHRTAHVQAAEEIPARARTVPEVRAALAPSPAESKPARERALSPPLGLGQSSASEPVSESAAIATPPTNEAIPEATLLIQADQALNSGNAPNVLRMVHEHARRFPKSRLAPEREALRIFALCTLGALDEAERAKSQFLESYASLPIASRVRAACGKKND